MKIFTDHGAIYVSRMTGYYWEVIEYCRVGDTCSLSLTRNQIILESLKG